MKHNLTQEALKVVGSPQVLVNIISKRVRQLGQGFRPLIIAQPGLTFMDIALKEVAEHKLGFDLIEVDSPRRHAPRSGRSQEAEDRSGLRKADREVVPVIF